MNFKKRVKAQKVYDEEDDSELVMSDNDNLNNNDYEEEFNYQYGTAIFE
jgi:hypothetical protein